jgi:hypothetical protein
VAQEVAGRVSELEQLKRRFEEFRSSRTSHGRLPQRLWEEAAEAAKRHGLNPIAQALHLDYNRLKKHMAAQAAPVQQKKERNRGPEFVELMGPAPAATTDCQIEVESSRGAKVRIELKGMATRELASLIHGLIGQ